MPQSIYTSVKEQERKEISEAIKIALDNFDSFTLWGCNGLCGYFDRLEENNIINYIQLRLLKHTIRKYLIEPDELFKFIYDKRRIKHKGFEPYYWEEGHYLPRMKYLQYLQDKISFR